MEFTSYAFIFFFMPILILGWYCINKVSINNKTLVSQIYLIFMSLIFYGWSDRTIIMIFVSTLMFNWFIVFLMQKTYRNKIRRWLCIFALIINIGVWLFFKCGNAIFFKALEEGELLIPLGISFYTVQQIMFLVDSYKNKNLKYNVAEYFAYSTFFPCIISGPIMRHDEFIPQLQNAFKERNINITKIQYGIISFSLGMGKKVLISKQLGTFADYGFSQPESISSLVTALCIISYSLQLYFDFSGYCDMAEGVSLILGFSLPRNFESPYKAKSIGEFWRKWHITLTRFLTQYVYIPLGGGINGKVRRSLNIVIVYIVSGFWHGAEISYILWGGIHAILMVIDKLIKRGNKGITKMQEGVCRGFSYILVSLAWVPFRTENISDAIKIYKSIVAGNFQSDEMFWSEMLKTFFLWVKSLTQLSASYILNFQKIITILFILCTLLIIFKGKNVRELREQYAGNIIMAIICGVVLWASVIQFSSVNTFIYEGF